MSNLGKVIKGYCNGFFGRDSYGDKTIEAEGIDWIVARSTIDCYPEFAYFNSEDEKNKYIQNWTQQQEMN